MAEATNDLQCLLKQEPEEIRSEMAESRSAITEKLEALEERVKTTVESAQTAVTDTFETVKGSVQDTVDSVKRTFDVRHQVDQHPWVMVGSAVAAGYCVGSMLPGKRPAPRVSATASVAGNGAYPLSLSALTGGETPKRHHDVSRHDHNGRRRGVKHRLLNQFAEEIGVLESAAIGAVMGLARDWLKQVLPPLAPHVEKALDSATVKMGGEPIHGNYS